jgi:predicted aldo/keto reductase-like oxidoreductase
MLYRDFGRTGVKTSILGFGCMRLPVIDKQPDHIDVPLATRMLHYAIEHGVNYVDTAFPYHGASFDTTPGTSEAFVGAALAGGLRDKVLVATKQPGWIVQSRADMDRILDGQLERLRTDCVDCYLMHSMTGSEFERLRGLGALEFLDAAKQAGTIRFAGFSFHDESPAFAPIVDAYDWDFCQIQYNYMDTEYQAGLAGLAYAASRGLGVVVMEPLKGGRLAGRVPPPIQEIWGEAAVRRTATEWALRYVWDDPRVSLLLSGMTAMEHVVENVDLAQRGTSGSLSDEELALVARVRDAYEARTAVDCTACRYCMPCTEGIDIPLVFSLLNNAFLFDGIEDERRTYGIEFAMGHTAPASACSECGQCEEACPQQLEVIRELKKVVELFESGQ